MIQKKFTEIVGMSGVIVVLPVGINLFTSFEGTITEINEDINNLFKNKQNNSDIIKKIKKILKRIKKAYQRCCEITYTFSNYMYTEIKEALNESDLKALESKISCIINFELETLKAHLIGFKPRYRCALPPKIVPFTLEEGQKLSKIKVTWTLDSPEVEKNIVSKLKEKKPFVFYRNGLFADVDEDSNKACNVIFNEICWDQYLLVVGDDRGLKKELEEDIQITAALAGLSNENLQKLYYNMQEGFGHFYGENAVFTLLLIPSKSVLEAKLKECILKCPNFLLTIIYSGHGEQDFGWVLAGDDRFSGSDLKEVLSKVKPQHYPKIKILLNCCYGLSFAEKVINMGHFTSFLEVKLQSTSLDVNKYLEDAAVLPDESGKMNKWLNKNEEITRAICEIVDTCSSKFTKVDNLSYMVDVVPYAVGPLEAKGILSKEKVKKKYKKLDWSKVRAPQKNLLSYSTVSDPQFFVFAAGNGDSTLFSWLDFNMLVDGGIYTDPPCFWRTVHQLPRSQKLNAVIVTHYDQDHIAGILRLFTEDPLPIEIDEMHLTEPVVSNDTGTRNAREGNELWDLAEKCGARKDLACDPTKPIINWEKKHGRYKYRLRIFMLTPRKDKRDKAAQEMIKFRGLTIPNQASASLLIECRIKKDSFKYALLTGDAPSEDIIDGLNQLRSQDKEVKNICIKKKINVTILTI